MGGDAVEIDVRFADTWLSATRITRGRRYVIGTAADVDLAVGIASAFTLVESVANGFLLRVPVGARARSGGAEVEGAFVLARGQRVEIAIGMVAIEIAHVADAIAPVPRPRASRRIVPYLAAALVAHVALVAAAMATATIEEPITIPVVVAKPPVRVFPKLVPVKLPKPEPEELKQRAKRKAQQQQMIEQAATASSEILAGGAQQQQAARTAAVKGAAEGAYFGNITKAQLAMLTGSKNLAQELADVGALYDEDKAVAQGFGGAGGAFDPTKDPAFDSVKVGPVALPQGKMGASYRLKGHGKFREVETPPVMGLTCDDNNCKTSGELDRLAVRDYVETKYVDMLKCFERHAKRERRIEVTLRFEITNDGHATAVSGAETAFGQCLERLVERTKFPSAKPTQVAAYTIAFWRNG